MGWNYVSIPKLQFHLILNWVRNYLSMLRIKSLRVSKRTPSSGRGTKVTQPSWYVQCFHLIWSEVFTYEKHGFQLWAQHHLWNALQWRHNERDGVSNHRAHHSLLTVFSGADQRKHQSSASLAFVRGIHWWPVNSPHKWPVTRKMFPFDDVIMSSTSFVKLFPVMCKTFCWFIQCSGVS